MNLSKFIDFYLIEETSKKTGKKYYAIVLRINDIDTPLCFLSKDRYDLIKTYISSN